MARRDPIYRGTGAVLGGFRRPDNTLLKESIRTQSQLQKTADRITQFALKSYEKASIDQGIYEASQDPQSILDKFDGKKPFGSIPRAQFETATKIAGTKIETQARINFNQVLEKAKLDNINPTDLKNQFEGITDGYAKALSQLDPETGAVLRETLAYLSSAGELQYNKHYQKNLDADLKSKGVQFAESLGISSEVLAREVPQSESHIFDYFLQRDLEKLEEGLEAHKITGTVKGQYLTRHKTRMQKSRVRGSFNQAEDKIKFIEKFEKDTGRKGLARGLDDADIKSLVNEFKTSISKINSINNAKVTQISKNLTQEEKLVHKGRDTGDRLDQIDASLESMPQTSNVIEARNHITYLKEIGPYTKEFRMLPLDQQQEIITQFRNEINSADSITVKQQEFLESLEKIQKDTNKEVKPFIDKLDEMQKIVIAGNMPSAQMVDKFQNDLLKLNRPDISQKFLDLYQGLRTKELLQKGDLLQAENTLNNIKRKITSITGTDLRMSELFDTLSKAHEDKKSQLNNDPIDFLAEDPDEEVNILDVNFLLNSNIQMTPGYEQFKEIVDERNIAMDALSNKENIKPKYLSEIEINQITNNLNQAKTPADKVNKISNLANTFGNKAGAVFEQMYMADKETQIYGAVGNMLEQHLNGEFAIKVLNGEQIYKSDAFRLEAEAESEIKNYVSGRLVELGITNAKFMDNTFKMTMYALADEYTRNNTELNRQFDEDIVEEILTQTLGGSNGMGGIQEYEIETPGFNESHFIIAPPNMNGENIQDLLDEMTVQEFTAGTGSRPYYSYDGKQKQFKNFNEDIRGRMFLYNLDGENYHVGIGDNKDKRGYLLDGYGMPIKMNLQKVLEYKEKLSTQEMDNKLNNQNLEMELYMKTLDEYNTVTDYSKGEQSIQTAVDFVADSIGGSNPENVKRQMMEIAKVESDFAQNPNTHRTSMSTGPFQFDEGTEANKNQTVFNTIQNRLKARDSNALVSAVAKIENAVNTKNKEFGIETVFSVKDLKWEDMNTPLYSAIMLRLFMILDPNPVGSTIQERAQWWKTNWNTVSGAGTLDHYINKANATFDYR